MLFSDIPGLQKIKDQLILGVDAGKVAQAVMFHGPEGNASLTLALAYAAYLNCRDRKGADACNECESCKKASKFIHPDIHYTYPVVGRVKDKPARSVDFIEEWRNFLSDQPYANIAEWMKYLNAEGKQGNITVAESREIIKQLSLKSFEGEYKIYIIWGAEMLGLATNALLKIIEEPAPKTVFILITYNRGLILPTLISRVQLINVPKFNIEDVEHYLHTEIKIDETQSRAVAKLADGNLFAASKIAEDSDAMKNSYFIDWFRLILRMAKKKDKDVYVELYKLLEEISRLGRESQKALIRYALFYFEESLAILANRPSRLDEEEVAVAKYLVDNFDSETLYEMHRVINNMHYHTERNANPRILFLSNTLKLKILINGALVPSNI